MNFSRRPGVRFNRGRLSSAAGVAGPLDPLSIVKTVASVFYLIGDLGITIDTGVSAWANQGPTGATGDATQSTGGSQPLLQSAALNRRNTLLFDGADDLVVFANLNLPAPGTTPTWFWMVWRQKTWTTSDSIFGGGSTSTFRLAQVAATGGSPNTTQRNGSIGGENPGAVLNSWVRSEVLFGNSAADYTKHAASTTTGTNTGNADPAAGAFVLGAHVTPVVGASNIEVAAFGAWGGQPSAGERAALDAWVPSYYGATVGL